MKGIAAGILVVALVAAWLIWPDGVTDSPLASVTIGAVLRLVAAIVTGALGLFGALSLIVSEQ